MKLEKVLNENTDLNFVTAPTSELNIYEDLDKLEEDTIADAANKEMKTIRPGSIEGILDAVLERNEDLRDAEINEFVNALFIGPAGCGKTARIYAWAKEKGIHLVRADASMLDETDLGGAISPNKETQAVERYATTEFDQLDDPRAVLFLDEFNRGRATVRGTLLTLINNHTIPDPRSDGRTRKLDFLFTVAAINPPEGDYNVEGLDQAELDRFVIRRVESDTENALNYFTASLAQGSEKCHKKGNVRAAAQFKGREAIASALLSHEDFTFALENNGIDYNDASATELRSEFSTRSLYRLLIYCDGTKEDFIDKWNDCCISSKKQMAVNILRNYKDINDVANQALKNHDTQSGVFAKKKAASDNMLDILDADE